MLNDFLEQAKKDEPVYITDVRNAFEKEGTRPFHLQVTLYDESKKSFPLSLPETRSREEEAFAASYVHAMIYNILSSLGAVKIEIYTDAEDEKAAALADGLDEVFQTKASKAERTGYGKSLNVNERILSVLLKGKYCFRFERKDVSEEKPVESKSRETKGEAVFAALPELAKDKMLLGIDIGGTDIKLTASVKGALAVYKEFDWFPAGFERAEQLIDPVLMLTRMMCAAASLEAAGRGTEIDKAAFSKDASFEAMERGIISMEQAAGEELNRKAARKPLLP